MVMAPMSRLRSAIHGPVAALCLLSAGCATPARPAESPIVAPSADSVVGAWLVQHPAVARAIVWESDRGAVPWASWDAAWKRALDEAFAAEAAALEGRGDPRGFPVSDPPANIAPARSRSSTVLAPGDAWRLYAAYVGHSLAVEILRTVPWSITSDPPEALAALFDGRSMFAWRGDLGGYLVDPARSGWVVPAPPAAEHGFLVREGILKPTRMGTVEAMIDWARRLRHVRGRLDLDNAERVWSYRGYAPVSRVLEGTGPDHAHVTAGCWGTTGLLVAVLRAANIPVRLLTVRGKGRAGCSHALPYFMSEGRYLSHGDDPYNQLVNAYGEAVPVGRLLVDRATWTGWFGEGVDPTEKCANIGRQTLEIALDTLPPYLVRAYCEDQRSGGDRRTGQVARVFRSEAPGTAFPYERLVQARVWERLAAKAAHAGGCGASSRAPAPPDPSEAPEEP